MKMLGNNEKHEKKNKMRLPLNAYLTYLLIATLLITGVSFSRYASTNSADDSASVAVVMLDAGMTTDPSYGTIDIMDGTLRCTCPFYVTNAGSEVALEYTVTVTLPSELPDGVTMQLLGAQNKVCTLTQSGNSYTYTSTFAAGTTEQHNYFLTFIGNEETLTGEYKIDSIQISVTAEQTN